jgi:dynein heavy chain
MSRLNDFILVESADTKEISVNFHPDLAAVIRETKYLDKLGYTIPETALNITLQVFFLNLSPSFSFPPLFLKFIC